MGSLVSLKEREREKGGREREGEKQWGRGGRERIFFKL